MTKKVVGLFISLSWLVVAGAVAQESQDGNSQERSDRGWQRDRERRGDWGRRGDRERRGDWGRRGDREGFGFRGGFDWSPENVEKQIDRTMKYYMKNFKSTYDLTDVQLKDVQHRLELLKTLELQHIDANREQRQILGEELRGLWQKRRDGEEIDTERMREIFDELREVRQKSPLLNMANAIGEVEKILPAGQVAKGRERREKDLLERDKQWELRRWLRNVERDTRSNVNAKGWWDRYVDRFIEKYKLDESQQSSASSVLRGLKQQRHLYRESKRGDYKALLAIEDRSEREGKLEKLNEPVDKMFGELKSRLTRIPTSGQMAMAANNLKESVQTRPAVSTTQPATGKTVSDE